MSVSRTYSASGSLSLLAQYAASGDHGGGESGQPDESSITFSNVAGWVHGKSVTCAAGDWLIAASSDPFGSMGDAEYPSGFSPSGKKVLGIYIRNKDATNSITAKRGATNGFPLTDTAGAGFTIKPGKRVFLEFDDVATSGSTDKITIAVSGGSPVAEVWILYGTP